MISRRQLIGCGVAASALGVGSRLAWAVEASPRPTVGILVVDERFVAAREVARSLVGPGIPRVALSRDVLETWHRRLAPVCESGNLAIAGVTTERGFFLLHTLAADRRMRVLSRTLHAAPRDDRDPLVSWMLGPSTMRS